MRGTRNCRDNLALAAAPLGVTPKDIPGAFCPFCEGHEDKTPPEIIASTSATAKPHASSASRLFSPASGGLPRTSDRVRLKRGAGAGEREHVLQHGRPRGDHIAQPVAEEEEDDDER